MPTPTFGGLDPVPYPAYPDELTVDTVEAFIADYELAFRHNEFIAEDAQRGHDELTVDMYDVVSQTYDDGYLVRADGEVLFADIHRPETNTRTPDSDGDTPTLYPTGNSLFTTWYYLRERFVLRYGVDRGLPEEAEPDFFPAETVICDDDGQALR